MTCKYQDLSTKQSKMDLFLSHLETGILKHGIFNIKKRFYLGSQILMAARLSIVKCR